ncbi:unnamed protein product, partial [marine sediment metagenome]
MHREFILSHINGYKYKKERDLDERDCLPPNIC